MKPAQGLPVAVTKKDEARSSREIDRSPVATVKTRELWHAQKWYGPEQSCSASSGRCSASFRACARCPRRVRWSAFSTSSVAPGTICQSKSTVTARVMTLRRTLVTLAEAAGPRQIARPCLVPRRWGTTIAFAFPMVASTTAYESCPRSTATRAAAASVCVVLLFGACGLVAAREMQLEHRMSAAGLNAATIRTEGALVRCWSGGRGSPVLLLHGFGGDARWQWSDLVAALSRSHTVIAPDLVWFGGSVSSRRRYSLAYQADVIAGVLRKLDIERTAVVGSSYGGFVALQLARDRPALVDRLVLIDSPGPELTPARIETLARRYGVREISDLFVPRSPEAVGRLIKASYADPPPTPAFLLRQIYDRLYGVHERERRALLRDLGTELAQLRRPVTAVPTLVVWGRQDAIFELQLGRRLVARLGRCGQLVVIDEAGHVPDRERPEQVERVLRPFLAAPHHPTEGSRARPPRCAGPGPPGDRERAP